MLQYVLLVSEIDITEPEMQFFRDNGDLTDDGYHVMGFLTGDTPLAVLKSEEMYIEPIFGLDKGIWKIVSNFSVN